MVKTQALMKESTIIGDMEYWDDIPYRKLLRGVIIIKTEDLQTVLDFLGTYQAEVHVRKVTLTKRDEIELA